MESIRSCDVPVGSYLADDIKDEDVDTDDMCFRQIENENKQFTNWDLFISHILNLVWFSVKAKRGAKKYSLWVRIYNHVYNCGHLNRISTIETH